LEHIGFGVGEPSAASALLAVSDLSTMRWVRPSRPDVVAPKRKDIHLRIPKHFRNMGEHPREVFMDTANCFARAIPLLRSRGFWPPRPSAPPLFIRRARHCTLDRMRDYLENGFGRDQAHRIVRDAEVLVESFQ